MIIPMLAKLIFYITSVSSNCLFRALVWVLGSGQHCDVRVLVLMLTDRLWPDAGCFSNTVWQLTLPSIFQASEIWLINPLLFVFRIYPSFIFILNLIFFILFTSLYSHFFYRSSRKVAPHWKGHLAQESLLSSCSEWRMRRRKELREYVSIHPTSTSSWLVLWLTGGAV